MPLKDPVCGMAVTEKSFHYLAQEGRPVYFCSGSCKARYAHKAGLPEAGSLALDARGGRLALWRRGPVRWTLIMLAQLMVLVLVYRQLA